MRQIVSALIDTNVVLDFVTERESFFDFAVGVISALVDGRLIGYISASQMTDVYYYVRKHHPQKREAHEHAINILADLMDTMEILPVNRSIIETAHASPMDDFEDAVQAFAAKMQGVDIVVTRDRTGFVNSGMKVFTPQAFLEYLEQA